jgi:hypothetical protein
VEHTSSPLFERYADAIVALPEREEFSKSDLLVPQFRLVKDGNLEIYYAPLDFISADAKVAIVGITPGWTQMEIAFRQARIALRKGLSASDALRGAKVEASFAGTMRKNLITMLDEVGLAGALKLDSCRALFGAARHWLHATSAIRYPVFVNGRNYGGHSPKIASSPVLQGFVDDFLAPELNAIPDALLVPLGACADGVFQSLTRRGSLDARRCLTGFPHPSGANGHRVREFKQSRNDLTQIVNKWFS